MVATGTSLTGSVTDCMTEDQKQTVHLCNMRDQVAAICPQVSSLEKNNDFHQCHGNRRSSTLFVEENEHSASFHSGANNWLAFWLYLVTSSYFLLSKKVNFFGGCSVKPEEKVSLSDKSIPNERSNNVNDGLCYSESLGSPHSTCSSTYYYVLSEISDFDRTSYWHSLLSLEEEYSELLSDSSTPLSRNSDSLTEISDADMPSYWDSLLKLEEEDNKWNLDKASYWDSLLSLEEEDSAWLSDSMISENPTSPLSSNCDSFTDISDIGTPSYWDSLLRLEEEDNEWISDKASYWRSVLNLEEEDSTWLSDSMISEDPSSPLSYNGDSETEISEIGTLSYWDSLLKLDEQDSEWISDSKQGLKCVQVDSDESTLCSSPRKKLVFEQKGDEDFDSDIDIPSEYFDLDQEFAIETLVGLNEFDGHEGLDSEFIDDDFMLLESLQ
ncbi:hypothetical protein P8452_31226 [Trifolium repens]|nr:hypothetical protein P8452_31226 [Trifolium repens]